MNFGGFQKLTLLDFPGRVACTLFTKGCNFRCPFCHNAPLVEGGWQTESYSEEEVLSYLNKRKGVLDGICVTGGEPLMHGGIADFLRKVKAMGYAVKLDTNGSYPDRLRVLYEEGLIDYVAMDIKNSLERYAETAGCEAELAAIRASIAFLMESGIDYEFRTTVVNELHTPEDIGAIAKMIAGAKRYFLQNFVDSGSLIGDNMTPVDAASIEKMRLAALPLVPSVQIRGQA